VLTVKLLPSKRIYSFADDDAQYALDSLLIANNRLQMDYDRLKDAGIAVEHELFAFHNSFIGLTGDASVKKPRLETTKFHSLCQYSYSIYYCLFSFVIRRRSSTDLDAG